ncbi:MAG: DUF4011 domain-containing protein [Gammaproteobacteria bacterium]|nr:DUF4011 domain-containing protein [Gammaproteobacteria bacterium]
MNPFGDLDGRIRLPLELTLLDRLSGKLDLAAIGSVRTLPPPDAVRRQLLGRAVRLTEAMAPAAVRAAGDVKRAFGLSADVEIYQSAGSENAAMHLLREPILMEIQGRLLSLLDEGALRAVFGHEFGHFIAHGPDSPRAQVSALATTLALADGVPPELSLLASTLSMARELTADRFALIATRDLDALLRLEMVATTGLPADALGGDTAGYLVQCRELVEGCLASGDAAHGVTHPEHGVRAWAAWLFSETDLYRELTGLGPGTRAIADVEALIERVLRRPGLDGSFQYLEPPPPELHELALAAAVLVAAADGTFGDEEAEIIEKTFASLVPDWRRLLDPDLAARRLDELAPVAAAYGPELQRPLFNLLVHVLTADGTADVQEFRRVAEIGRVLGCEELFATLTRSLLRRVTVERRELAETKPLPVRSRDVAPALDAYLAAVARRGGAQVTVRRLLRLAGTIRRDPKVIAQLMAAIDRAGLRADADLAAIGLDDPIALTPIAATVRGESIERPAPGALERAIKRLRDELISGDGHSPSVRLREVRLGRSFDLDLLSRISVGHAERCLALLLAGRRAVLVDGEQAAQSKEAAVLVRQLNELRREHLARMEEVGARDLHIGTGFICGVADGYVVRAPLLLHPVTLERAGESGIALVPLADEPPIANQAVFRAIHHKAGLPFTEELATRLDALAADPAQGAPALVAHLRDAGFDVFELSADLHPLDPLSETVYEWKGRRLELEACAVVGLFPQSSSDLLEDYEQLLADLARPDADAGALLACARELLPAGLRDSLRAIGIEPRDAHVPVAAIVPSDPSQVEVVRMARTVPALVVDGPPGTGKSQVIVNLVADALARGERVAVISEKRAALDVVANRLAGAGLGALTGVVHDVFDDRKALYRKIQARLAAGSPESSVPAAGANASDRDLPATSLRQRITHLRSADAGEPSLGMLAAYAAGFTADVPAGMPPLDALPAEAALKLARVAQACRPWADLLAEGSPWQPAPGEPSRCSLAGTTEEERTTLRDALAQVLGTAVRIQSLGTTQHIEPAQCADAVAALKTSRDALQRLGSIDGLIATLLAASNDRAFQTLAALRAEWMSESGAWQSVPAPVRFEPAPELTPAVLALFRKGASPFRFLSPAWWKARGIVQRHLPVAWPDALGRPVDAALAQELHRRIRLAGLWARLDAAAAGAGLSDWLVGDAYQISSLLDRVVAVAEPVHDLCVARPVLEALHAWREDDDHAAWLGELDARLAAAESWQTHLAAVDLAARVFHRIDERSRLAELRALYRVFFTEADRAAELDRYLAEAAAVAPGAELAIAACADAPSEPSWSDLILKAWAIGRVEAARDALPAPLRGGHVDDSATARLAEALEADALARRRFTLQRTDETPLLRIPAPEKFARRTPEQTLREKLQRETARQRGLMPLRTFVRAYAENSLFDVLPVWLLSPETLAVLFPRKPVFDLVIFDEASQCTVANGFPALLRARRAVIAGDDRQMPPTSFFKVARDDEETATDNASHIADLLDAESLLTLARQRMPSRSLAWHYRCREEELIAFSNHAMYGGTLLTCPSPVTPLVPPVLRWVAVEDARYEDGRNEKEADKVVDLMHELLGRVPLPTVGVVTFNLSQRRTVLDAIDRRRAANPEFAQRYGAAESCELLDDRPFVKNIENVQGDERDVIIFSLGHAAVERRHKTRGVERYVPARFGPIGQRGGERRLNVAVSRARAEALVVASFEPSQLSVARAKNDGPRLFKAYLEFAHHLSCGSRKLAERVLDLVRSAAEPIAMRAREPLPGFVPLAGQVAEALLAQGRKVTVQLGASRFKVDVAVEGDADGRHYRVAILCDEGIEDDGAFRRTQRAALLRRRGWRIVHVDSVEWLEERASVLRRIEQAVDGEPRRV